MEVDPPTEELGDQGRMTAVAEDPPTEGLGDQGRMTAVAEEPTVIEDDPVAETLEPETSKDEEAKVPEDPIIFEDCVDIEQDRENRLYELRNALMHGFRASHSKSKHAQLCEFLDANAGML